jgi:hypothetical protein
MALRIHDGIVRGELDNRERGVVRGRLWLHGETEPVALDLQGNACPDLAGCLLTFENLARTFALPRHTRLAALQRGAAGDLTASRKVRVPDVPLDEFLAWPEDKGQPPERLANCLYLEWFSDANGRVVLEGPDFKLTVSAPAWRLSPDEEARRQRDAEAAFSNFMQRVTEALEKARHEPPEDKDWDEFDYEKLMRESDARTDKVMELMDKYRDHPDCDAIIAREMGWDDGEDEEEDADDEDEAGEPGAAGTAEDSKAGGPFEPPEAGALDELVPDPATEGVDWVRDERGDIAHPLYRRALANASTLWHRCKELGLAESDDEDLMELISRVRLVGAKLAGALNSLAYGRDLTDGPFLVARLKRALGHVHDAQAALESTLAKGVLPADLGATVRRELFGIREEILRLMEEFRHLP